MSAAFPPFTFQWFDYLAWESRHQCALIKFLLLILEAGWTIIRFLFHRCLDISDCVVCCVLIWKKWSSFWMETLDLTAASGKVAISGSVPFLLASNLGFLYMCVIVCALAAPLDCNCPPPKQIYRKWAIECNTMRSTQLDLDQRQIIISLGAKLAEPRRNVWTLWGFFLLRSHVSCAVSIDQSQRKQRDANTGGLGAFGLWPVVQVGVRELAVSWGG